jgi:hypothetical protein
MIIIVHGPPACGKTYNRDALRAHFGCARIVDGWEPRTGNNHAHIIGDQPQNRQEEAARRGQLFDRDLLLTTASPAEIAGAKQLHGRSFAIHPFETAIEAAGGQRN